MGHGRLEILPPHKLLVAAYKLWEQDAEEDEVLQPLSLPSVQRRASPAVSITLCSQLAAVAVGLAAVAPTFSSPASHEVL